MLKITGFDKLTRQLDDAQRVMEDLDGDLGSVSFEADDPGSIEIAISSMEAMIDSRCGRYVDNPIVAPLIQGMKEEYREAILRKAAAARLEGEE